MKQYPKTRKVCILGIGIALYVVLGLSINVPLVGHIKTDLGYIAYGVYLYIFGPIATISGTLGCTLESVLYCNWFPHGWIPGQIFIGITCGLIFRAAQNMKSRGIRTVVCIAVSVVALFIGIGLIKTVVECVLYNIPFAIKFPKNCIAFFGDTPPMLIGVLIGEKLKEKIKL